jgi:porphobilinogen synthase
MKFPIYRPRRLRQTPQLRALIRENVVRIDQLVAPLFVREGKKLRRPIDAMPGIFQFSADELVRETREICKSGVNAVLIFGIPDHKDERASGAYAKNGIVQRAVRALKKEFPQLLVMTDVCLCEYMSHGHCGIVRKIGGKVEIRNDETLKILAQTALSHAESGADLVAPSDMMDGRVAAIRQKLDENGCENVPIMSYAAKFASALYGPFREAAESAPKFGDRKSYQMDSANAEEALREIGQDIAEGADIVMVKPGLANTDLIWRAKQKFGWPMAVYSVSGEFSMVKAAAARGWIDEKAVALEILTAYKRAGADILITYWAKDAAKWLR